VNVRVDRSLHEVGDTLVNRLGHGDTLRHGFSAP
jgi:hypothetical protein